LIINECATKIGALIADQASVTSRLRGGKQDEIKPKSIKA